MSDEEPTADGSEYRPTDWLAVCELSYGIGHAKDQAVLNALQYAGPFEDTDTDTVTVAVWNLYADSWESHGPTGPERSADQLSYEEWELPIGRVNDVARLASDAYLALSRTYDDGERVRGDDA